MNLLVLLEDSGNTNGDGDYSGTPASFSYTPGAMETVSVQALVVCFNAVIPAIDGYGATPLSNGLAILLDGVAVLPETIKKVFDWRVMGGSVVIDGRNVQSVLVFPEPISMTSLNTLTVYLNDDFTQLSDHKFLIRGTVST